jgi:RNA polymerase sigma-70 factor (ECF subfamily)
MMAVSAETFESDRRLLWGLCYRMTGCAADADDIVQETFTRALEYPPKDQDRPVRPWLVRVAMNLSRDYLRLRRRRGYTGQWLPSPLETEEVDVLGSHEPRQPQDESPLARYEMLESVSFAFLLALEALTPSQRAVLLLREVFDYSTAETADALGISQPNVKVLLHRGRQRMQEYDKSRPRLDAASNERTRMALEQFLLYLQENNVEALERLLKEDVVLVSDGGGEVLAALNKIVGRDKVIRFIRGVSAKAQAATNVSFRVLNGSPAVIVDYIGSGDRAATRFTLHCETDEAARISRLHFVLAPSKLTAV